jgi:hypothetical protein
MDFVIYFASNAGHIFLEATKKKKKKIILCDEYFCLQCPFLFTMSIFVYNVHFSLYGNLRFLIFIYKYYTKTWKNIETSIM